MFYEQMLAEKGANLLDEKEPGWHNEIDINKLDIASCKDCVLGQLGQKYVTDCYFSHMSERLGFLVGDFATSIGDLGYYGFAHNDNLKFDFTRSLKENYAALTKAWKQIIIERREVQDIVYKQGWIENTEKEPEYVEV